MLMLLNRKAAAQMISWKVQNGKVWVAVDGRKATASLSGVVAVNGLDESVVLGYSGGAVTAFPFISQAFVDAIILAVFGASPI